MTETYIKRSITFMLEKRRDKETGALVEKNVPIRMSVTYGGQRLMLFTGHRVDANKWDKAKQRVRNGTTNAAGSASQEINGRLDRLSSGINTFFKTCEVNNKLPTHDELKEAFRALTNEHQVVKRVDLFEAFDRFTSTVGKEHQWTQDTYGKFDTIKKHLLDFDSRLRFSSLTTEKLISYVYYLGTEKGNRNTTIEKNIDFVKWFLKWADKKGYPVLREALDFKPRLKGTDGHLKKVVFLTIDELKHLYTLEIPKEKQYLARVRDVFVFCCFSGLRYSDVYKLRKIDDKGSHIEIVTQKTSTRLKVEVNKYTREILDHYKNEPLPNDKALPVITNQKMNEYLKELGELAGLDAPETIVYFKGSERIEEVYPKYKLLTTHCARKSFVTNLIYMGVSDHVIRQWTGHRDSKSFDVYHKMIDEIKAREMAKFDDI